MTDFAAPVHRSAEFRLHPLGFFYLQDNLSEGMSRRVHIWLPDGVCAVDNDRHQHAFTLTSTVKVGCLRNELFQFRPASTGSEREFRVSYTQGRSALSPTGRVGELERIATFESSTGTTYFLDAGVIHRVNVIARPCVTFVKTQDRGIKIYSYGDEVNEAPFERRVVTTDEALMIERVLGSLA